MAALVYWPKTLVIWSCLPVQPCLHRPRPSHALFPNLTDSPVVTGCPAESPAPQPLCRCSPLSIKTLARLEFCRQRLSSPLGRCLPRTSNR